MASFKYPRYYLLYGKPGHFFSLMRICLRCYFDKYCFSVLDNCVEKKFYTPRKWSALIESGAPNQAFISCTIIIVVLHMERKSWMGLPDSSQTIITLYYIHWIWMNIATGMMDLMLHLNVTNRKTFSDGGVAHILNALTESVNVNKQWKQEIKIENKQAYKHP